MKGKELYYAGGTSPPKAHKSNMIHTAIPTGIAVFFCSTQFFDIPRCFPSFSIMCKRAFVVKRQTPFSIVGKRRFLLFHSGRAPPVYLNFQIQIDRRKILWTRSVQNAEKTKTTLRHFPKKRTSYSYPFGMDKVYSGKLR